MFGSSRLVGLLFGTLSALIGGAWQVMTRQATTTTLAPADLALLRYCIPALVLLPVLWRIGLLPRAVPRRLLFWMVLGAGLPFGLVAMTGTKFAPSAHMGVMMAGASPVIAALLSWLLWRDRPDAWRGAGLALMGAGVALLGAQSLLGIGGETWRGDMLFLLAATLWAGFTLSFRRTGLTPWQGAAIVNASSALLLVPWLLWQVWFGARVPLSAPASDVATQALWQGVLAGLFGLWTFSVAIEKLGAARAAAFGALVPVVSSLAGWWWLGDRLGVVDVCAVVAAVLGVALASGAFSLRLRWPVLVRDP